MRSPIYREGKKRKERGGEKEENKKRKKEKAAMWTFLQLPCSFKMAHKKNKGYWQFQLGYHLMVGNINIFFLSH